MFRKIAKTSMNSSVSGAIRMAKSVGKMMKMKKPSKVKYPKVKSFKK